jgi:hypothetical protein
MAEFTFTNLPLRGRVGHFIIRVYKKIRELRFRHDITVDNKNVCCCSSPIVQNVTREEEDSSKSNGVTVQPPYDPIDPIDPTLLPINTSQLLYRYCVESLSLIPTQIFEPATPYSSITLKTLSLRRTEVSMKCRTALISNVAPLLLYTCIASTWHCVEIIYSVFVNVCYIKIHFNWPIWTKILFSRHKHCTNRFYRVLTMVCNTH